MSYDRLLEQARAGSYPPVCVLVGTEALLSERLVDALRAAALGDGPEGFNEDVMHGQGLSAGSVLAAARTLPMMAKSRFVLVRHLEAMPAAELEKLLPYLAKPAPETCLLMLANKLEGRGKFAKAAKKAKVWVDAKPPRANEMRGIVNAEARTRGHKMQGAAAGSLADAVGADLAAMDDALERLSLYVGEGQPITEQDVEACVSHIAGDSIWVLVDAVSAKNARLALSTAGGLLADREHPLRILSMVARQLRTVAKMRDALQSGLRPQEAAQKAGAPPFKARELSNAAKRFDRAGITRAMQLVAQADLELKGSKTPGPRVLERTLLDLCT